MEEEIQKLIKSKCNIKEKILLKFFNKFAIKVFNIARVSTVNCFIDKN